MAEQNDSNARSDMEKLEADPKTIELAGTEVEVAPIDNSKIISAVVDSERRGEEWMYYKLTSMTLNKNDGFDVTPQEVQNSKGNILGLMLAVQEVNGLDFSKGEGAIAEMLQQE